MNIAKILLLAADHGAIERPCHAALDWLGRRNSILRAWADCPHGDWLLWLLQQVGCFPARDWVAREVTAPAFRYAGEAQRNAGLEDTLTAHAVALEAAAPETVGALLDAAWAADAAAWAAADAAAWPADASTAARDAAWAVRYASWAVVAASDAARANAASAATAAAAAAATTTATATWAAGSAARDVAAAYARADEHKRCSDAVRRLYPHPPAEVLAMLDVR